MEDCRNCRQYDNCPCGKRGHENGTSIGYSIGECKDFEPKKEHIKSCFESHIAKR